MAFWIEGWVEVTRMTPNERDEHAWHGVLRLSPIVDAADRVSEGLFGLSKRLVEQGAAPEAVAAGRGIPEYPSAQVRAELEQIRTLERQHGAVGLGGYTWASWPEVNAYRAAASVVGTDWALVFEMVDRLLVDGRFQPDGVRVIAWYNW